MADTFSGNIKLRLQQVGGNNNSWGTYLNTNLDTIDARFGDTTSISTTGGNTTLTDTQETVGQIDVSGTLASNAVIIFSGRGGFWIVNNQTSGNYSVTCKVSGQTGVTIDQGGCALVWCNGTDIKYGNPPSPTVAEVTVASATTTDVLGAASEYVAISGTTTITSLGTGASRKRFCRATGAFKLTHNATSLILPGGNDITAEVGDTFIVISDASSNARVVMYQRATPPPSYLPVGLIADFGGSTPPSFWLFCYGQAVSRTTYAKLYEAIGEYWGSGNGVTTFNLPDLRGRVTAGKDNMGGTSADRLTNQSGGVDGDLLGVSGGAETHTLSTGQLPTITPAGTVTSTSSGVTHVAQSPVNVGGGSVTTVQSYPAATTITPTITSTFSGTPFGSGQAHNNVQPTAIVNKIIYAGV